MGIMNGYNNGDFMPDKLISREEVVKVLYYLTSDETGGKHVYFSDVATSRWSYIFIKKMSEIGAINGYENGEFKPEKPMKRAEIVAVLGRIFD